MEIPLARQLQDGYAWPLGENRRKGSKESKKGNNQMTDIKQRSLLERIAAVLSPAYKIIKFVFDVYVLVHTGH